MGLVVYAEGRFLDTPGAASVSLFDRGYLLGDAVFETLRAYGGAPFRLEAHLARLARGAAVLGVPLPEPLDAVARIAREAARRVAAEDVALRITLSRGPGPGGVGLAGCGPPTLTVVARPLEGYPPEVRARGIATRVVSWRRIPAACLDPSIKAAHYLPAILARRELEPGGFLEGVQLAVDGQVAGGTVSNLFLVEGARLVTPWLESGCLPGVTRATVLEVASGAGLEAVQRRVEVRDLEAADELFFASTLMEVLAVRRFEDRELGPAPGPATAAVQAAFRRAVERDAGRGCG